ncbi:MAG TPA: prepilin-type N-terminal cleavage/methylation domain-containing protein, partial [Variovorax sp.]|nr:prepilin-type N-terminal cleavage/methylation domain-containing protein [Variovorax sp.]
MLALMRRIRRPSEGPRARTGSPGFTLVELMVVLAIMSLLLVLATPSFMAFLRNAQLASAAHSFV